jgi:hypothetical protein
MGSEAVGTEEVTIRTPLRLLKAGGICNFPLSDIGELLYSSHVDDVVTAVGSFTSPEIGRCLWVRTLLSWP